jgi:Tfp pilus assembly protein PilV
MHKVKGFSLTDILVALILISSCSLMLFKQHWSVLKYAQQLRLRNAALIELDNFTEYWMIGDYHTYVARNPFKLQWIDSETVRLSWFIPGNKSEDSIQRTYNKRI